MQNGEVCQRRLVRLTRSQLLLSGLLPQSSVQVFSWAMHQVSVHTNTNGQCAAVGHDEREQTILLLVAAGTELMLMVNSVEFWAATIVRAENATTAATERILNDGSRGLS